MSLPREPLKQRLADPVDEAALARVWQTIEARMARAPRRWRVATAALWVVAAAVAMAWFLRSPGREPGPLRLADGGTIAAVEAPPAGAVLALSDGSRITLANGARLDPLESTDTSFAAVVRRGSVWFEVRPGGPRRWQIECGLATVEVVGTGFSCERTAGKLHVAVQHGVVLVRGERVPDRARRLTAGESLDVYEDGQRPDVPVDVPLPAAPSPRAAASPVPDARAGQAWRELARDGKDQEAFAALGARGVAGEIRRVGVGDLLLLADVARLSGHPAQAVAPLGRILRDFPRDAQAPLAAFALGRLELDALDQPAAAAAAFERALELGAPAGLREDLRARLVEANLRAGDPTAARAAADAYAREFPNGRYTQSIRSRLP